MAMLSLLELAAGRLTATGLEQWLANPALQDCTRTVVGRRHSDHAGFAAHWFPLGAGCKGTRRGDETHGLRWCLDRWLSGSGVACS